MDSIDDVLKELDENPLYQPDLKGVSDYYLLVQKDAVAVDRTMILVNDKKESVYFVNKQGLLYDFNNSQKAYSADEVLAEQTWNPVSLKPANLRGK